jgi:transcriptional regulator GlxA family with amidase domain
LDAQAEQHWILVHLSFDLTVKSLASRTAMSVRNFPRAFQQAAKAVCTENLIRVDELTELLKLAQ